MNLNKTEKDHLLMFMDILGDFLGNAGCNDLKVVNTPENREMLAGMYRHVFAEEPKELEILLERLEKPADYFWCMDWMLLNYLESKLK